MHKPMLRASAVLGIVITALLHSATPSRAACLAADVVVHRTNQADQPVVTDGDCVGPLSSGSYLHVGHDANVPTATGVPSGAWVEVWVPIP